MAETFGVGAAVSGALENFLANQAELKHRQLMDQIAVQREQREDMQAKAALA